MTNKNKQKTRSITHAMRVGLAITILMLVGCFIYRIGVEYRGTFPYIIGLLGCWAITTLVIFWKGKA